MGAHSNTPGDQSRATMRYWLARVLRMHREAKGVSFSEIAQLIPGQDPDKPYDASGLSKFEAGKNWPQRVDAVVAAYAAVCGVIDGRELWAKALKDWSDFGGVPLVERQPNEAFRSLLLAQEAARRSAPYADESRGKPTSTRRKKAEG